MLVGRPLPLSAAPRTKKNNYIAPLSPFRSKESTSAHAATIRSERHQLFTMSIRKKALDAYDTKRVILADGINTLPYGHYLLDDKDWCAENLLPAPNTVVNAPSLPTD